MTYREAYQTGKALLEEVPEGDLDARLLLEFACGTSRSDLLAHGEREVSQKERERYLEMVSRRKNRIPLQHITGQQDFMGMTFRVDGNVLIPRQDTEILVEEVLRDLHGGSRILDLCTGSGCILISLLKYSNECTGVGTDISGKALELARGNAAELIPEEAYQFLESDLFEKVEGKFDVLVSNPPYIASAVIEGLMPEVRDHEPRAALDGGEDGLCFYRKILRECPDHLFGGASVFFEIGCDQAEAVVGLMREAGFTEIRAVKDYAGLDRVVCGIWKGMEHV